MTGNLGGEGGRENELVRELDEACWACKERISGEGVEPGPVVSAEIFEFAAKRHIWRNPIGQSRLQPKRGRALPIRGPEFPCDIRGVGRIERREETIWNNFGVGDDCGFGAKSRGQFPGVIDT